jgi:hypothetical protein
MAVMVGRRWTYPMLWAMNGPQLEQYRHFLLGSRSWRFGSWIRAHLARKRA